MKDSPGSYGWAIALATGLGFIGIMSLLLTDGRTAAFH